MNGQARPGDRSTPPAWSRVVTVSASPVADSNWPVSHPFSYAPSTSSGSIRKTPWTLRGRTFSPASPPADCYSTEPATSSEGVAPGCFSTPIDPESSTFEVGFTHGPAFLVPHSWSRIGSHSRTRPVRADSVVACSIPRACPPRRIHRAWPCRETWCIPRFSCRRTSGRNRNCRRNS